MQRLTLSSLMGARSKYRYTNLTITTRMEETMAGGRQDKQTLLTVPKRGTLLYLISGVALGMTAAYFLEPRQAARRRAVARDKALSSLKQSVYQTGKVMRHLRNRLGGALHSVGNLVASAGEVSDRRLESRVRSVLGRTISHPHQVDLTVHDGRVSLRGSLKPHEVGLVVQAIEKVPGVRSIDNQVIDVSAAAH